MEPNTNKGVIDRFLDWLKSFFQKEQEETNFLVLKTFSKRNFCSLTLLQRNQPRAIATYRAIPLYSVYPRVEIWVLCEHLLPIPGMPVVKSDPSHTHRIIILETPPNVTPDVSKMSLRNRCKILWQGDLNLRDDVTRTYCATTATQMIATALINNRHEDINWVEHVSTCVAIALKQQRIAGHVDRLSEPTKNRRLRFYS